MAYQWLGQLPSCTELWCSQQPAAGSHPKPHKSNHTLRRSCHDSCNRWPIRMGLGGGGGHLPGPVSF